MVGLLLDGSFKKENSIDDIVRLKSFEAFFEWIGVIGERIRLAELVLRVAVAIVHQVTQPRLRTWHLTRTSARMSAKRRQGIVLVERGEVGRISRPVRLPLAFIRQFIRELVDPFIYCYILAKRRRNREGDPSCSGRAVVLSRRV